MLLNRKPKGERPTLIVQAMIRKNTGEYLAIKRAMNVEIGSWEFPGGRVDPGESIEHALEREVKEETGLKIDMERFVGWGQGFGIKEEPSGKVKDRFVMFFECKLIKGKLKPDDGEIADHKWVSLEDMMGFSGLSQPVKDFFSKFQVIDPSMLREGGAVIRE